MKSKGQFNQFFKLLVPQNFDGKVYFQEKFSDKFQKGLTLLEDISNMYLYCE